MEEVKVKAFVALGGRRSMEAGGSSHRGALTARLNDGRVDTAGASSGSFI